MQDVIDPDRLRHRLDRERRARLEAEAIAERGTRELYERKRELELLNVIATGANGAGSVDAAVAATLREICVFTEWPLGHAYYTAPESLDTLVSTSLWHISEPAKYAIFRQLTESTSFTTGQGLPGRVLVSGRSAWITDLAIDSNFPRHAGAVAVGLRGAFAFPILAGKRVVAVLEFFSPGTADPSPGWTALVEQVGTQLGRVFERQAADEALRAGDARFHQVAENIHQALWILEIEPPRVSYVSPRFAEIWGVSDAALHGSPHAWLNSVHAEDRGRIAARAKSRGAGEGHLDTYRIVRPDGAIRWVRHRTFCVRDGAGQVRRLISLAEDFTEQKKLEEQLLRSQRLEAIGTLAGGVAHDLNNILAPLLMAAELLKNRVTVPRDRDLVLMMEQGAQRGADIVKQLLAFSRGVEGGRSSVAPAAVLAEMTTLMRETFPRDLAIVSTVAPGLATVQANPTQLHQVLMNLCVNARDAMPRGGTLTLTGANVTLTAGDQHLHPAAQIGAYVVFSVADTGEGIPRENLNRIFDPFFTTKEVGKGTGLGLSTVLGIVRSHGGFITVYSELGRGTVFKVYLPAETTPGAAAAGATTSPTAPGRGELVIVVDDEPAIREATRELLQDAGYRVITAPSGREALLAFLEERETVRLVLTDLMMPGMSGAELAEALRALEPEVRIIATTGLDQDEKRAELAEIGVTEILTKPCAPAELLAAVHAMIARTD